MKTATASALRSRLSNCLEHNEPVIVTRNGRPKAVLLSVREEADVERLLMANNAELMELLDAADQRISATGGIPHDEFWRRVGKH
jgi:prevent-host-death family protein